MLQEFVKRCSVLAMSRAYHAIIILSSAKGQVAIEQI